MSTRLASDSAVADAGQLNTAAPEARSNVLHILSMLRDCATGGVAEASQARARLQRSDRVEVRVFELAAVRRLVHAFARRGEAMSEGERAAALADFALMSEAVIGGSAGGPYAFDELVRRYLAAKHDGRKVVADIHARYFGTELDDTSLTPGNSPHIGATSFASWLAHA